MNADKIERIEISQIKDFVNDGRFDDAVQIIALYIGDATEEEYLDRLEDIIETLLTLHGGRTVLRFLMENLIIDIPSLLENLSKKDSVLRYTFLSIIIMMLISKYPAYSIGQMLLKIIMGVILYSMAIITFDKNRFFFFIIQVN